MSKFSGQKWRRGKRRNRQETEGLVDDNQSKTVFPRNFDTSKAPERSDIGVVTPLEGGADRNARNAPASQRVQNSARPPIGVGGRNDGSLNTPNGVFPNQNGSFVRGQTQEKTTPASNPDGQSAHRGSKRLRRRTKRLKNSDRVAQNDVDVAAQPITNEHAGSGSKYIGQSAGKHYSKGESASHEEASLAKVQQVDGHSLRKRNTRRKGVKPRQAQDEVLRNMRNPVSPAPKPVFVPKADAPSDQTIEQGIAKPRGQNRFSPARARENVLYAALDLGTNNCRLLIATPQERGKFRVVDGFSKIVRLGEGLAHTGKLSENAMNRAVEALKICAEKLMSHTVSGHRLIATEACRQAANGEHFLSRVKAETGMELEIIDRETEAYLAAEGCGALMDRKADAAVLFDIGGGSSELVLVNSQGRKKRISDQIVSWTSLPVGVVTLAERHGGAHVNKDVFQSMVDEVRGHLSKFEGRDALARVWKNGRVHLLGTSGTVTTLAGIHLGLQRYERRLVDGLWLAGSEVDVVIKDLLAMDYSQRAASPCIGTERADLVMAGCAILEGIRQFWPSDRLRVADRGLREGMLTQMMERDAAWLQSKNGRRRKQRYWNQNRANSNISGENRTGNE